MTIITLDNDALVLQCRPQGAAVLSLTAGGVPVLRPAGDPAAAPGDCAMFPMLPMANRIAGNAFDWRETKRNLPKSPYDAEFFLHGDGWISTWDVLHRRRDSVIFTLTSSLATLYRYRAELCYRLQGTTLSADLRITNLAEEPFPYGAGFHPFFVKPPSARLCFQARGYWPEQRRHLPGPWRSGVPGAWDFSTPRPPGDGWINNAFSGWQGRAELRRGRDDARVILESATDILMVYQPQNSDFICLEPQTHPVNAHNMPGLPGLHILAPQESLSFSITVRWSAL
ncbi:aldose 1-epimerase [Martelella alba]|uniref:Aldose 1-epimerase n=1 Tax=Martelella alba TaxID=2590451 RepID=A0ABY2SMK3_9HYPH|nr:aldose 1-epimerase [Martelella alba]TKI06162.1 aldose 1-epimerase [Martelella alba]